MVNCNTRTTMFTRCALSRSRAMKKWFLLAAACFICIVFWVTSDIYAGVHQEHPEKIKAESIQYVKKADVKVALPSGVLHGRAKEKTPKSNKNGTVRIVIFAYYRSGSSYMGSIFNENNDTFYNFEPLWPLYHKTMPRHLPLKYFNGTQRNCPKDDKEALPTAKHILSSVLDCRFADIDISSLRLMQCAQTSNSALKFCSCKQRKSESQTGSQCVPDYTKLCLQSKYRVIKSIRLDMDMAETLIRKYPDVKIIHLLRDPRGRVCSSLFARKCNVNETQVQELCDKGNKDITERLQLEQKYPNSFKQVIYEDMVADPEGTARAVFKFVGTELPTKVKESLLAKINPKGPNTGPYGLYRKDGLATAYQWSKSIQWPVVELINKHCKLLINHARFPNINSAKDLTNFKIPDRLKFV